MSEQIGIPGYRGVDHVGFTVPNMEEARHFLVNVLGCEEIYSDGPFTSADDTMTRRLGVHPRAEVKEMCLFRFGMGSNFEVFEWASPDQSDFQPKHSDLGGHHIALYVDDIAHATDYLRRNNVEVLEGAHIDGGPAQGESICYFRAPWGLLMELVSYPKGKRYEAASPRKLWDPKNPAV